MLVGSGSVELLSAASSLSRSLSREAIPGLEDNRKCLFFGEDSTYSKFAWGNCYNQTYSYTGSNCHNPKDTERISVYLQLEVIYRVFHIKSGVSSWWILQEGSLSTSPSNSPEKLQSSRLFSQTQRLKGSWIEPVFCSSSISRQDKKAYSLCSAQSPSRKPQRDSWHQEDQRHHHSRLHESLITSWGSKIFSITSIYSLPLTFLNHSWFPLLFPDLYEIAPSLITTRSRTLLNLVSLFKRLHPRAVLLTDFQLLQKNQVSLVHF